MAKTREIWKCDNCGQEYPKQRFGKCSKCNEFSTYSEVASSAASASVAKVGLKSGAGIIPTTPAHKIKELNSKPIEKFPTGINELDRVLGGGFVEGEVVLFGAQPGSGKALQEDTLIAMYDGSFKPIREIRVGDIIIDMYGMPTNVVRKFRPDVKRAFRMTFDNTTTVDACEDHIWNMVELDDFMKFRKQIILNTELFKDNVSQADLDRFWNHLYNFADAVADTPALADFDTETIFSNFGNIHADIFISENTFDDYVKPKIQKYREELKAEQESLSSEEVESQVFDRMVSKLMHIFNLKTRRNDYCIETTMQEVTTGKLFDGGFKNSTMDSWRWMTPYAKAVKHDEIYLDVSLYQVGQWLSGKYTETRNGEVVSIKSVAEIRNSALRSFVQAYRLYVYAEIPEFLFASSIEQRTELLRGFVDSKGVLDRTNRKIRIQTYSESLVQDLRRLLLTLNISSEVSSSGFIVSFAPSPDHAFDAKNKTAIREMMNGSNTPMNIRVLTNMEPINVNGDYYCLMVDSDSSTFLCTEEMIVTHNSTLSLSIAEKFAQAGGVVLYSSGEESKEQVALRASRMEIDHDNIRIINTTSLETIIGYIEAENPKFVVVDSLQTVASSESTSTLGSITQSKEAANTLTTLAKERGITMLLINQMAKNDDLAGSNQTTHIVDCVIILESDSETPLKFLRATKNRFGDTSEVGVFQHNDKGLGEVSDPSGILIDDDEESVPGTAISFMSEGVRQIPVEVQALVVSSPMPNPRKQFAGVNYARVQSVCGVLDKFCRAKLYDNDLFVNTASGIKVTDPTSDLAVAAAIVSSAKEKKFPDRMAFVGELSLTGKIKGSSMITNKIKEAIRLKFTSIIVPKSAASQIYGKHDIKIHYISHIRDLQNYLED